MRRCHDLIEVRRADQSPTEFLWRGRLWWVRAVLGHWVETGAWWTSPDAAAVLGTQQPGQIQPGQIQPGQIQAVSGDLLAERELWRVEAGPIRGSVGGGVFDLAFEWSTGLWRMSRCLD